MDNSGLVKGIFITLLIVAAIFLAISFGRPYYRYYNLDHYAHDELLIEVGSVAPIKSHVLKRAKELGVHLEDFEVTKNEDTKVVTVTAHWTDVVDFWGYYTKKLHFDLKESY